MREDAVRRPHGTEGDYGVVDKPVYALVIPLDGDRLHLVEQLRYPSAGGAGSPPPARPRPRGRRAGGAAVQELREERGSTAGRMELIGQLECSRACPASAARYGMVETVHEDLHFDYKKQLDHLI